MNFQSMRKPGGTERSQYKLVICCMIPNDILQTSQTLKTVKSVSQGFGQESGAQGLFREGRGTCMEL